FSSRRRHTRCLSDWSSDVCSSDLSGNRTQLPYASLRRHSKVEMNAEFTYRVSWNGFPFCAFLAVFAVCLGLTSNLCCQTASTGRSEERRVGKECRCRWSACQCKKE